jgi:hypothetical protein
MQLHGLQLVELQASCKPVALLIVCGQHFNINFPVILQVLSLGFKLHQQGANIHKINGAKYYEHATRFQGESDLYNPPIFDGISL